MVLREQHKQFVRTELLLTQREINYGDVMVLTGRLMEPSCESESCSRLSTSKTINATNNVVDARTAFARSAAVAA